MEPTYESESFLGGISIGLIVPQAVVEVGIKRLIAASHFNQRQMASNIVITIILQRISKFQGLSDDRSDVLKRNLAKSKIATVTRVQDLKTNADHATIISAQPGKIPAEIMQTPLFVPFLEMFCFTIQRVLFPL